MGCILLYRYVYLSNFFWTRYHMMIRLLKFYYIQISVIGSTCSLIKIFHNTKSKQITDRN